jgi:hypothetical protein
LFPPAKRSAKFPFPPPPTREQRLKKAIDEILLKPAESIRTFTDLIDPAKSKPDQVTQEALAQLKKFYLTTKSTDDFGKLLTKLGYYKDALEVFYAGKAPPVEIEKTSYEGFLNTKDKEQKSKFLLKNIEMLVGPLKQTALATERIRLFEKTFPRKSHPYAFYVKSDSQKAAELFRKTSFAFVENLLKYLKTEFPQLRLKSRPLVQLKKLPNGLYRVEGSYKGDVMLSLDKLSGIHFHFCYIGGEWTIFETNLTEERSRWAKANRQRDLNQGNKASELFVVLETVFRKEFPENSLHESTPERLPSNQND